MNDLFDNSVDFDALNLEEDEQERDDQFNTAIFGYNKKNVLRYIDNLENNIKQMQNNLEVQIKELLNEKEILAQEKKYLESEYSQVKDHKELLEEELKQAKSNYENLLPMLNEKEEIERLNVEFSSEMESLSDENEELYIKIKELHNLLDLADQQKERFSNEISLLEQKILESDEYILKLENNNALMNRDISENENKIKELNQELEIANANHEKIRIELKEKLEKIESMAQEITEQKAIISNLEEEKEYFKRKDKVSTPQENPFRENFASFNRPYEEETNHDINNLKVLEEIRIMKDQLDFVIQSNEETHRVQKAYFDKNFDYMMERVDRIEEKTMNKKDDRYSKLIRDFIDSDDAEEISKLYKYINENESKPEKESMALRAHKRRTSELQEQINRVYDRLLQSS